MFALCDRNIGQVIMARNETVEYLMGVFMNSQRLWGDDSIGGPYVYKVIPNQVSRVSVWKSNSTMINSENILHVSSVSNEQETMFILY